MSESQDYDAGYECGFRVGVEKAPSYKENQGLRDEIERLREENSTFGDSLAAKADRIDRLGETVAQQVVEIKRLRTEIEPLRIALGLLTTIKPTMEIDVTDPVGMAQQIAAHVADEIERLRGLLEDACHWHEQFPIQRVSEALGE